MKNAKVYSYLRFSDPKQSAGSSIDRQMQYAARWATEHKLTLDDSLTLRDEGLSAYHQRHVKHGALGVFLQAIDDGRIAPGSVLIVEGLDRLSRAEPIQAQAQLAQIINAGITVVTASDNKEYNRERLKANPMDLVYSLLVMIRAHEESETKSKRVKAAFRHQAEEWLAGNFRGRIATGHNPEWLKWSNGTWVEIAERCEALRFALRLYKKGHSGSAILIMMSEKGMSLNNKGLPRSTNFYRMLLNPALYGTRNLEIDGQKYQLENYYPSIISHAEWLELQAMISDRTKRGRKSEIQPVISGMGILRCGYCGGSLAGQFVGGKRKRKEDGTPHDGHRRLLCGHHSMRACPVHGSCSSVPVENAIIDFCSDQLNLTSLTSNRDLTKPVHQQLLIEKNKAKDTQVQLNNLTEALLSATTDAPRTFIQKANQLESILNETNSRIAELEAKLAEATKIEASPSLSTEWAGLAEGVKTLDNEARLKAKQLVYQTFERIIVYSNGILPKSGRKKGKSSPPIDLILIPKGGKPRTLRINRKTGEWIAGEDVLIEKQIQI
ncbi:recombinase family protein [Chromobacterium piscinae]|uniref:recombinase family protein n=1 Tax=Chromobacterium piscinae TaxID=686831 RepID=UPI001E4A756A|nr:recombinase family protein [Chromobacterium piscinae]MCD4504732.1 recombinase family protein [Chromobacterium piscinae]